MNEPTPSAGPALPTDPAAAQGEVNSILQTPTHAYWQAAAPGHREAVARMESLYRVIHPEPTASTKSETTVQPKSLGEARSRGLVWRGNRWEGPDDPDEEASSAQDQSTLPPAPEGWTYRPGAEEGVADFRAVATELGMDAKEATRWVQTYVELATAKDDSALPDQETVVEQLREEWGSDFEENLAAINLVSERLPASVKNALEESGLGDHPDLVRRALALGKPLLEAQKRIDALQADRTGPLWDQAHPKHQEVLQELTRLYEVVYGKRPVASDSPWPAAVGLLK